MFIVKILLPVIIIPEVTSFTNIDIFCYNINTIGNRAICYAALDPDEGLYYVAFLEGEALKRFRKWITQFRKSKYSVGSDS